jgi:hypothetical protein
VKAGRLVCCAEFEHRIAVAALSVIVEGNITFTS